MAGNLDIMFSPDLWLLVLLTLLSVILRNLIVPTPEIISFQDDKQPALLVLNTNDAVGTPKAACYHSNQRRFIGMAVSGDVGDDCCWSH